MTGDKAAPPVLRRCKVFGHRWRRTVDAPALGMAFEECRRRACDHWRLLR